MNRTCYTEVARWEVGRDVGYRGTAGKIGRIAASKGKGESKEGHKNTPFREAFSCVCRCFPTG